MFQYFTKLLEQYTKVLIPPKDVMKKLEEESKNEKNIREQVSWWNIVRLSIFGQYYKNYDIIHHKGLRRILWVAVTAVSIIMGKIEESLNRWC